MLNVAEAHARCRDTAATEAGEPQTSSYPCPCCGGRMIVIETFERGCAPRHQPTRRIRIDSSRPWRAAYHSGVSPISAVGPGPATACLSREHEPAMSRGPGPIGVGRKLPPRGHLATGPVVDPGRGSPWRGSGSIANLRRFRRFRLIRRLPSRRAAWSVSGRCRISLGESGKRHHSL